MKGEEHYQFEEGLIRFCHRTGLELRKCNRHHDLRNRPGRVLLRRESHSGSLRRRLRAKPPNGLTENARREISRRFSISIGPKGICADLAAGAIVSSSSESIRGASETPRVSLAPRKSLGKTLRVSGYHPPGVNTTVSLAPRVSSRTRARGASAKRRRYHPIDVKS